MSKKVSAKERMLKVLKSNTAYNTFSVAQGRNRFGVKNVSQRIHELRQDGHSIYTNIRHRGDGSKVSVYRLGTPTKTMRAAMRKAATPKASASAKTAKATKAPKKTAKTSKAPKSGRSA